MDFARTSSNSCRRTAVYVLLVCTLLLLVICFNVTWTGYLQPARMRDKLASQTQNQPSATKGLNRKTGRKPGGATSGIISFHSPAPEVKVLLLTYMRSGSTFLGELFNQNSNAFFLFETLDGVLGNTYGTVAGWLPEDLFHFKNLTRRPLPEHEVTTVAEAVRDLLGCSLDQLPVEAWLHRFTFEHLYHQRKLGDFVTCMRGNGRVTMNDLMDCQQLLIKHCGMIFDGDLNKPYICHEHLVSESADDFIKTGIPKPAAFTSYAKCMVRPGTQALKCIPKATSVCNKSQIRCLKAIRFSMDTMEELLNIAPDVKVIHYIRDPRGVARSRSRTGLTARIANGSMTTDARLYCGRVLHEVNIRRRLEQRYPNTFMQMRYEDLAQDPAGAVHKIHGFLGLPVPAQVLKWAHASTHASKAGGSFDTRRTNSSQTAFAWQSQMTPEAITAINTVCKELLEVMGYPLHV